jgi:hypothetical protein
MASASSVLILYSFDFVKMDLGRNVVRTEFYLRRDLLMVGSSRTYSDR